MDLEAAPLAVTAAAGEAVELPVRFPATGRLAATAIGEGAVAVEMRAPREAAGKRLGTAWVTAADRARTVILAWHPPEAAAGAPLPASAPAAALEPARPRFSDLATDERRSFTFEVTQGGALPRRNARQAKDRGMDRYAVCRGDRPSGRKRPRPEHAVAGLICALVAIV